MRAVISVASLLPLLAAASPVLVDSIHHEAAPVVSSVDSKEIPNQYMVVFKKDVDNDAAEAHHTWVQQLHTTTQNEKLELKKRSQFPLVDDIFEGFKHSFNIAGGMLGYAGHFDDETIEMIRRQPDVAYIEKDSEVRTQSSDEGEVEKNAPWGLARISHRDSLSFGTYNKYLYSEDGGEGVDAYVIDTGTNIEHVDFEGRASWGKTIPTNDADEDGNGHGTHCSGTVGGKKYGVAKKVNIYAVKVLRSNGSGSMSDVVKGVEYAASQHAKKVEEAKAGKHKKFKGSVANMSLGGGKSTTLDLAVNAAVDAGLNFAVAAGNDNADSCKYSPAAAEKAVTVGASTFTDDRAYFSNYGTCNDIFAPGLDITSTWIGSKYATNKISGTSMASPHIAGLLAYMLSLQPSSDSEYAVADITPKKLKENLLSIATKGALADVGANTENLLAWNGGGSSNYSDIVDKGAYEVGQKETHAELPSFEWIEKEFENAEDDASDAIKHVQQESSRLSAKFRHTAHRIEDFVSDELKEFMEDIEELET